MAQGPWRCCRAHVHLPGADRRFVAGRCRAAAGGGRGGGCRRCLALARLRLPGVLVRSAAGTSGLRSIGAAVVADLPETVAVVLVSDGDPPGRAAVVKLHGALHEADRTCYAASLIGGADLDALLRGAIDVDLADRHGERAAILEYDGGLPRPAATARALARMIETLAPEGA